MIEVIPTDRSDCNGLTRFRVKLGRWGILIGAATVLATSACSHSGKGNGERGRQAAGAPASFSISPAVPNEIGGGAPTASIQQAAAFAWQEFFALNWPAKVQTGSPGDRDAPSLDCKFGDPNCASRPLVWQTFRGKAEIFTSGATQPYDQIPTYADVYSPGVRSCDGKPDPAQGAWINLDETTEISLNSMYAGIGNPQPSSENSAPQLIRFMAKANRAEYDYVQKIGAKAGPSRTLRQDSINYFKNVGDPPPGSIHYVSLPNNTIEIKAGWRMLGPRDDPKRFHSAKVRYYEGTEGALCYREAMWGLVALHIIQKTPSAPYFIYATFEQAENILTAGGRPTEDENGKVVASTPCRNDQTAPCPTTPSVTLNDTDTLNLPSHVPPNVQTVPGNATYCTASLAQRPVNRLYYLNAAAFKGLPSGGYVCVNSRDNPIPAAIIHANVAAHRAIADYGRKNGISASPWAYYKLINVQYQAIDKDRPGQYGGNDWNSGHNPASFYLGNIVVETNRSLQLFSGGLVAAVGGIGGTGSNSDYATQFGENSGTHKNTYYNKTGYNMGGCLGCHGSQGQSLGGDFSVILERGTVGQPEPVPDISPTGLKMREPASRRLAFGH